MYESKAWAVSCISVFSLEFIPTLHEEVQLSTEHLHFLVGVLILLAGLGMIFVPPLVEDHLLN